MITDKYGQQIYSEKEICDIYLTNPDIQLKNVLISDKVNFSHALYIEHIPELIEHIFDDSLTIEEFDEIRQDNYFIPSEYAKFDIAKFVLDQCQNESELQRVGEELLLYQEREMFPLLCYLKYLVDTMRANNIVWGVGRGSSVASFVLFLIGVHKINSLYYDLPIDEFLK
jgi:DNA polymerase III alpha subunit